MNNVRRASILVGFLSVATAIVAGIQFARAVGMLRGGPGAGYEILSVATMLTAWTAVLGGIAVALAVAGGAVTTRAATLSLLIAGVVTGGVSAGMWEIGTSLGRFEASSQPVSLNSLILAFAGVGIELAQVPAILVLCAGVTVLVGASRRWFLKTADFAVAPVKPLDLTA